MTGNPYYFVFRAPDAAKSAAFFGGLFGWQPNEMGHVENLAAPGAIAGGGASATADVYFSVASPELLDVALAKVVQLGGQVDDMVDSPTGLSTTCHDDQGTRICLGWERPEFLATWEQPPALADGEIGYVSLPATDANKAVAFYSEVLGWTFFEADAAHEAGGHRFTATPNPPVGIHPAGDNTGPTVYLRVGDVAAFAAKVEELGGSHTGVIDADSGANADCLDDQGTPFALWTPAPGYG